MLRWFLVIVFSLVCGPAFAAPPHILVVGDSLSAGYGIETAQGWVTLLKTRLAEQGYDYAVVNASISGDTTYGGLARLPSELVRYKPAIVILELGANDGLRGLSIRKMRDNLGKMVRVSRQSGASVLLIGILLPPNYGPQYTKAFAAVYPAVAREYQVSLLPFLLEGIAQHRELMQADGLHPLAVAEPQVLDNIWRYLKPLLKTPDVKRHPKH